MKKEEHLFYQQFLRVRFWGVPLSFLWALGGGIMMGLTPAPVQAFPLAWIALIPLWLLLLEGKGLQSLIYGFVWGLGYHGLALFWITGVHPMTWLGVPWLASLAIALFCWFCISIWGALLSTTWVLLWRFLFWHQNSLVRVLMGIALWCGLETLWSWSPLYWSSLAYTQSPHNLIILHLGQISGPNLVTGAIVLVNGLLAESLYLGRDRGQKLGLTAIILLLAAHGLGFTLYHRPIPIANPLKVGIIQGNIPNQIKLNPIGWGRAIEGYTTGYLALANQGVEAVLTPETALPFLWDESNLKSSSFYQAVVKKGILAWVGSFNKKGDNLTNSLLTLTGDGKIFSSYDKVHLVPLGEYIPFMEIIGNFINRLSPLDAHLVFGSSEQIFETPLGRAIVGICYDSAYPDHFQRQAFEGGQFILTASNNAHYSITMPAQHHAQDVMRSIEVDRWAVRATNTGYSAFVDPHGRTLWLSQINTYQIHTATIDRRNTQTLYVRWGDWLTKILLGLAVLLKFTGKSKINQPYSYGRESKGF